MVLVAAQPHSTCGLVLILVDLRKKQLFGDRCWDVYSKPAFVLAVHDLTSVNGTGGNEPVPGQSNVLVRRRKELMNFLGREVLAIARALWMGES